jgi:Putative prokaryotic signal transducing protein
MSAGPDTGTDTGTGALRWARAATFKAAHEAELARQQLEAEDIPVALRGDVTGIFGPGYMGPSPRGVTVLVPSDRVQEARELIQDMVDAFGGSTDDDEG